MDLVIVLLSVPAVPFVVALFIIGVGRFLDLVGL